MHHLPGPVLTPLTIVVIDDPPRGQVMGQHAPGTATAQQLEDRVQDFALGIGLGPPSRFRFGHERLYQAPFFIAEISRIRLSQVHARDHTRSCSIMGNFLDTLLDTFNIY